MKSRRTKKREDIVGQLSRKFGASAIALFRRAFIWAHGEYDSHEVRTAHEAHKKRGLVPCWLRRWAHHIEALGVRALPT